MISDKTLFVAGGLMLGALAAWVVVKGASGAGEAVGGAAVGAARGVILGIGDGLGIPRTSADRCSAAKAARDCYAAMTYCGAVDYLAWRWKTDGLFSTVCK